MKKTNKNTKQLAKKNAVKRMGADLDNVTGKTTRQAIETAHMTAKDAGSFTSSFIKNFRK